ncbi:Nif11-like leader peptide family natural product precursor [Microseira sp. BLCC-F43]|jgi:predicted ribosomally synthesized peptide with nif11-like leader|uniref:Nif11-like leader peptide family natural product precursor n=1 Tax=Microseira sp. BLCC-F43 TaxID=3153602 RepID=UPI0035B7B8C5
MTQDCASRFFKAAQQDEALQVKLKATTEPETFIKIAADQGYHFTVEQLQAQIEKLPPEAVASMVNPGVGPRLHLVRR